MLTSNIFAILGLRAMYFLLAAVASKFHLLSYGLTADGGFGGNVFYNGFATGAFNVVYDTAADRVQLVVTQAVTAVPEPGTYAMLLAGLAVLGGLARRRMH